MEVKTMTPFFEKCFQKVLEFEGGYSNHPADRGGKTKYGITEEVARRHGYTDDMKDLPLNKAKEIYLKDYYEPLEIEKIYLSTDERIAYKVFDIGVNMGIGTSAKLLQKALNYFILKAQVERGAKYPFLVEDGKIGRQTLSAIQNLVNSQTTKNTLYTILSVLQGQRYLNIIDKNPSQVVFLNGWLRRV